MSQRTQRQQTQSIYFQPSSSYEIKISLEGYQRVLEIIREMAVCGKCGSYYSTENPQVAGLLCLSCFLESRHHLTYQGPLDAALHGLGEGRYSSIDGIFSFLDKEGYLHTTQAGPASNESPTQNVAMTLSYWHFPRPEKADKNGKTVILSDIGWKIYGNVKEDDIVLLQYGSAYYGNEALFLAKRRGEAAQLSRRKQIHRELLAGARAELEATYQQEQGEKGYLFEGKLHFYVTDEDVYRQIAKRVNQERQALLAKGNNETEPNECEASSYTPQLVNEGETIMARRTKKEETFDFTFEGKKYVIRQPYQAQAATIVLSDGKILQVRLWKFLPVEPEAPQVETFDPQAQDAAELAKAREGFLAELVG